MPRTPLNTPANYAKAPARGAVPGASPPSVGREGEPGGSWSGVRGLPCAPTAGLVSDRRPGPSAVVKACLCVSTGLGEAWGHSSRTSPLDNVGRELGSHLLQVQARASGRRLCFRAPRCASGFPPKWDGPVAQPLQLPPKLRSSALISPAGC